MPPMYTLRTKYFMLDFSPWSGVAVAPSPVRVPNQKATCPKCHINHVCQLVIGS